MKTIKELANQAGFNDMGIWKIIGIEEYHQRFAALIIEECYNTMIKSYKGHINPQIGRDALNQHFGVESE